jgi:type IV secretion system protein VirB10
MANDDDKRQSWGPNQKPAAPASPVDQDVSAVATGRSFISREAAFGGLVVGGVALIAFVWLFHGTAHVKPATKPVAGAGQVGQRFQPATQPNAPPVHKAVLPLPAQHRSYINPFAQQPQDTPAMQALQAPILAPLSGGTSSSSPAPRSAVEPAASRQGPAHPGGLSGRLSSGRFSHVNARMIAHPNFTISAGTIIPCTLETAIDSGLPGFVKCVLPQSVRSMTGSVTLLDRGTQVLGEIQQGLVQGQDRLFILWTRAITPQNVVVRLGSPGAGALGRAGISGAVNNHFFQRFGAAIMLSVIGGSLQVAANSAQSGAGNTYFQELNGNTNQIANTALQSTIDIPPTLTRNQGANVSIFVARDLNFSHVYKLGLVNP